jgi:hypothetical protein
MKPVLILSLVTALGIGGTYLADEPVASPSPSVYYQDENISPLERARRSTVVLSLTDYRSGGTAILVGRKNLDSGGYRYRALTAQHVIRGMSQKITKDGQQASRKITLMFQQTFHGAPLRLKLSIDDIDWASPTEDWASFTFDSTHRLTCVEVATKAEFLAIQSFEKIYAVGAGGLYGVMCRDGIMGATHNEHLDVIGQRSSKYPWHNQPHKFFRPYIHVWYGDSGGGVFSKEGKLIGIINGFDILHNGFDRMPVTFSTVAVKAHLIKDLASSSKDFFLIEE